MASVFPVPGGPSMTETERVRAFSTAARLTEIAAERKNGGNILGPRLDRRAAQERIKYALGVNESELFVSGPHGIVAGKAGYDCAPVAHPGHRGSLGRRGDDAHLGSRVGAITFPGLRSLEDSRPCTAGIGEGQDLGRALPGSSVNFDPFAFRQRVPLRIAENPHAVPPVGEGPIAVHEYDFDSLTYGQDLRYVRRPVFKLICRAIANQSHHHLSCDVSQLYEAQAAAHKKLIQSRSPTLSTIGRVLRAAVACSV
jgi:hypothetical protein